MIQGYVLLKKEPSIKLFQECLNIIHKTTPKTIYIKEEYNFLKRMFNRKLPKYKTIPQKKYPNWWYYKNSLINKLNELIVLCNTNDNDLYLSLLSYNELIKLSRNQEDVNCIFILDY